VYDFDTKYCTELERYCPDSGSQRPTLFWSNEGDEIYVQGQVRSHKGDGNCRSLPFPDCIVRPLRFPAEFVPVQAASTLDYLYPIIRPVMPHLPDGKFFFWYPKILCRVIHHKIRQDAVLLCQRVNDPIPAIETNDLLIVFIVVPLLADTFQEGHTCPQSPSFGRHCQTWLSSSLRLCLA